MARNVQRAMLAFLVVTAATTTTVVAGTRNGSDEVVDSGSIAEACEYDASGEESLLQDNDWWCAVRRAECFAEHNKQFCGNQPCVHSTENDHGQLNISEKHIGTPSLFCRRASSIIWHWEQLIKNDSIAAILVSVRQSDEDHWILHDVVSVYNFTLSGLVPNGNHTYQLRVQAVSLEGRWSYPCTSRWTSVLNDSQTGPLLADMKVLNNYEFSENYVNVSVLWKPAEDDMSCDYKIVFWAPYTPFNSLEEQKYHTQFTGVLPFLQFNSRYEVNLYSLYFDQNVNDYDLRRKYIFNFKSPSCLELWNNNLTICSPPPPVNLNITFLNTEQYLYEMNVSWEPGFLLPEEFIVTVIQCQRNNSSNTTEELQNRSETVRVAGNVTTVQFKNIDPTSSYIVRVTAVSNGGNSTPLNDHRKITMTIEKSHSQRQELSTTKILIIILVILLPIGIGSIVLFFYRRHCKQQEETRISQRFTNLDKEPTKEKNYESAAIYYDDEWEIPEDRLLVSDRILGEGAFGVVREGLLGGQTQQEPLQEVAVKMLPENPTSEDIRQFQKEIGVMKSIGKHHHIFSIKGCCTCSKTIRLIVEYCDLGNLMDYLRENWKLIQNSNSSEEKASGQVKYAELLQNSSSNSENETSLIPRVVLNQMYFNQAVQKKIKEMNNLQPVDLLSFARQISMGMEFLANNRIVHRDLAARNILVKSNKTVKISDFGLSRDIYEQNVYHKKGPGMFPIKWMALESLMYQIFTTQSDIWSFGILLWEIVTMGAVPYPGTPPTRIFQLLKSGYRMECPSNCSQELYEIMLSCWRAKPQDRPTFTELRNKLDDLLANSSPQQYLNLNILDADNYENINGNGPDNKDLNN